MVPRKIEFTHGVVTAVTEKVCTSIYKIFYPFLPQNKHLGHKEYTSAPTCLFWAGNRTEVELTYISSSVPLVFSYLQSSALIRERGAEESGDNTHHYFCDVLLQYGVSMLSVTGVVASLQDSSSLDQKQLNQNRLIRITDWRCLILHHSSQGSALPEQHLWFWHLCISSTCKGRPQHSHCFNTLASSMFRSKEKKQSSLEEIC